MLILLLKADFYFRLYTDFYTYILQVQIQTNLSLLFLKVILFLQNNGII